MHINWLGWLSSKRHAPLRALRSHTGSTSPPMHHLHEGVAFRDCFRYCTTDWCRPDSNNEHFSSSTVSISLRCWYYRGFWHQAFPPVSNPLHFGDGASKQGPSTNGCTNKADSHRRCLPFSMRKGQVAGLLQAIALAAVCHAPSPESNPYPPQR